VTTTTLIDAPRHFILPNKDRLSLAESYEAAACVEPAVEHVGLLAIVGCPDNQ